MRIVLLDNYDSFTYNLVQAFQVLGAEVVVVRNDRITVTDALALDPTHVVVSPGPGRPEDAGISMALVEACLDRSLPLLGVCLGHQALGAVLGAKVRRAERLMHGKSSLVQHDGRALYQDISNPFEAGRYHSLIVEDLPPDLERSAYTAEGELMGMRHRELPAEGVQFHPESILTPEGAKVLGNFLRVPLPVPSRPRLPNPAARRE